MKVAVVGAGGVGGYFGARLAAAGTAVHFIARGAQLAALQERGLEVASIHGDLRLDTVEATGKPADVGPCDVVLFCVKAYDTDAAAADHLPPLVGADTVVVSLQNGIDNAERIARVAGAEHVVGGLAFIIASLRAPGHVVHSGGPAKLVVGELDGSASTRVGRLVGLCEEAGIAAEATTRIREALWDKFAFICAQAGVTAAARLPIGDIRAVPEAWALFRRLVGEVYAVARAEGVDVAEGAVDERVAFAEGLEPASFSSLHDDLVAGRRMELDALHGTVVRLARRRGVAVPMHEAVYAVLAPWAARNERAQR
jgi:2-dehydropantoate 2-reductase